MLWRGQSHPESTAIPVMIWPLKGFLSSFLVLLVTGPLSCESGLCEGHGSSKLRYLVCEQSWGCAIMALDQVVPESLFLLQGELCIGSVGISCVAVVQPDSLPIILAAASNHVVGEV